ncbi:MAG: dihydroorotate dehydrogenase electron transfer subunit [Acidobacteria bacterium]|nr:dihydroorotate dehydrogenase electron transfer subunit [Acidobacteriota bacterium]
MIDTVATVQRNDLIVSSSNSGANIGHGRRYGYLRLRLDQKIPVLPGQFAMLKPREVYEPLLRRAMAYYRSATTDGALQVDFIYQILGRGTQALAKLRPGDQVDFLGSLGNTYDVEAARGLEALLVAGGVGSAALYMLAEELRKMDVSVKLFIGGAGRGDLCGLEDFIELLSEDNVICATVDGSCGEAGFVTTPLERHLHSSGGAQTIIYACGPDPMLHRVSQIAERFAAPSQLSLEAPMGCGYGVCVGCAVAVKDDCPEGFVYKKACVDGPIFGGEELRW